MSGSTLIILITSSVALSTLRVSASGAGLWVEWWSIVNWNYVNDVYLSKSIPTFLYVCLTYHLNDASTLYEPLCFAMSGLDS